MIGMRFCAGLFFPGVIETEIFSASITEFKGVLIKNSTANFTVMKLHTH